MSEIEAADPGRILSEHFAEAELMHISLSAESGEAGAPGFVPPWFSGDLPILVYPPLSERKLKEGDSVNLEITSAHVFFGAMRELADGATPDRAQALQRLGLELDPMGHRLFEGQLRHVVLEGTPPGFLPDCLGGEVPVLLWPPLPETESGEAAPVEMGLNLGHLYHGALRELAETADVERGQALRQTVLEWNPGAAEHLCRLARERIEADLESALLYYEVAQELAPDMYEAVQDSGMCELALASTPGEDPEERLANAEDLFRRALEIRPQSGLSAWSLARVLTEQGAEDEAQYVLEHFMRHYPEGDQTELVLQALQEGFAPLETMPSPEEQQLSAQFQRGVALAFGEDPAEAIRCLQPLAEAHPEVGQLWFSLGAAYRRLGDHPEAERCLRRAARLTPGEPFIWWELARTCMELEEWEPGEAAIRKAIQCDPGNAQYHADLARVLVRLGDRDAAEDALAEAVRLAPDDPEIAAALDE